MDIYCLPNPPLAPAAEPPKSPRNGCGLRGEQLQSAAKNEKHNLSSGQESLWEPIYRR